MSRNTGGTLGPVTCVHDTAWIAELIGDAKGLPEQRVPVCGTADTVVHDIVSETLARRTGCWKSARPDLWGARVVTSLSTRQRWLAKQTFDHPAQQIVFQDHVEAINVAQVRLAALEQQLREIVPTWTMAPVVAAYQALRGVSFLVAITFVAEVGDVRRFASPQQLMAFLGLVPSERTTGDTVRRGSITKTGNHRARRVLIEGAWTYRFSARVGETLRGRLKDLPLNIRSIAWKAQVRLCARYRRLIANGKKTPVATTAIARELAAFLWAIGQQVAPLKPAA